MSPARDIYERLMEKVYINTMSGCWIFVGSRDPGGYGTINYAGTAKKAHRVSWELHVGPIPNGMNVLHKCDVTHCINPEHLFLGTQKDNAADMIAKGRRHSSRGENHPMCILTEKQVLEIRSLIAQGNISQREIAAIYRVTEQNVYRIKERRTWKHI